MLNNFSSSFRPATESTFVFRDFLKTSSTFAFNEARLRPDLFDLQKPVLSYNELRKTLSAQMRDIHKPVRWIGLPEDSILRRDARQIGNVVIADPMSMSVASLMATTTFLFAFPEIQSMNPLVALVSGLGIGGLSGKFARDFFAEKIKYASVTEKTVDFMANVAAGAATGGALALLADSPVNHQSILAIGLFAGWLPGAIYKTAGFAVEGLVRNAVAKSREINALRAAYFKNIKAEHYLGNLILDQDQSLKRLFEMNQQETERFYREEILTGFQSSKEEFYRELKAAHEAYLLAKFELKNDQLAKKYGEHWDAMIKFYDPFSDDTNHGREVGRAVQLLSGIEKNLQTLAMWREKKQTSDPKSVEGKLVAEQFAKTIEQLFGDMFTLITLQVQWHRDLKNLKGNFQTKLSGADNPQQ